MSTQRQIICPVMTLTSLGNLGGELKVIEYDMTHWSKEPGGIEGGRDIKAVLDWLEGGLIF